MKAWEPRFGQSGGSWYWQTYTKLSTHQGTGSLKRSGFKTREAAERSFWRAKKAAGR